MAQEVVHRAWQRGLNTLAELAARDEIRRTTGCARVHGVEAQLGKATRAPAVADGAHRGRDPEARRFERPRRKRSPRRSPGVGDPRGYHLGLDDEADGV